MVGGIKSRGGRDRVRWLPQTERTWVGCRLLAFSEAKMKNTAFRQISKKQGGAANKGFPQTLSTAHWWSDSQARFRKSLRGCDSSSKGKNVLWISALDVPPCLLLLCCVEPARW